MSRAASVGMPCWSVPTRRTVSFAARSIGPAIVGAAANPTALAQVWLFIVAPLIGAGIAGLLFKSGVLAADED